MKKTIAIFTATLISFTSMLSFSVSSENIASPIIGDASNVVSDENNIMTFTTGKEYLTRNRRDFKVFYEIYVENSDNVEKLVGLPSDLTLTKCDDESDEYDLYCVEVSDEETMDSILTQAKALYDSKQIKEAYSQMTFDYSCISERDGDVYIVCDVPHSPITLVTYVSKLADTEPVVTPTTPTLTKADYGNGNEVISHEGNIMTFSDGTKIYANPNGNCDIFYLISSESELDINDVLDVSENTEIEQIAVDNNEIELYKISFDSFEEINDAFETAKASVESGELVNAFSRVDYVGSPAYVDGPVNTIGLIFTQTTYVNYPSEITFNIMGDVVADYEVNVRDCAEIASKLANGKGNELPSYADYNCDNVVNIRDAATIANYLATK